jgi:hypothetical protein
MFRHQIVFHYPQLAPSARRSSKQCFAKKNFCTVAKVIVATSIHLEKYSTATTTLLGTFGVRRSSKTGFNNISVVQCVNRYLRTKVGIAVDRNNTKVDTEPKVRAGKLRRNSKEWNRLKDEKAIQTSIDYYRVIIKCKGHECNFVRAVSRVYK